MTTTPHPARTVLHQKRISGQALARELGCSRQFVSQMLLGQVKPTEPFIRLLEGLLQQDRAALFNESALKPSPHFPGDELLAQRGRQP